MARYEEDIEKDIAAVEEWLEELEDELEEAKHQTAKEEAEINFMRYQ